MEKGYIKTRPRTVVDVTKIVTIHYYEFGSNFVFSGESHNFWELVYVDKGSVAVCRDGEEIVLQQGQVIFHKPNEFHSIRALDSAPNFMVISFASTSLAMAGFERCCMRLERAHKNLLSAIIKEAERCYIIPKNDTKLRQLRRRREAPLGSEQLIKTYLEQLLIFLLRAISESKEAELIPLPAEEVPLVGAIKEYLTVRSEENVRIEDVCRAFGYSKSFLSRVFREHTGQSLAAFARKKKIDRAKELIREGRLNFTQIAAVLSFEDPQYFSRVFKKESGMTPTEYKNRAHV